LGVFWSFSTLSVLATSLCFGSRSPPVWDKLKYAEFAMTEGLKKDYDALPASTKDRIQTIQQLCELFLSNRVMLAVASSILSLTPTPSSGGDPADLAANLQYLTNVEHTTGFEAMSGPDLVSSVLSKQYKYGQVLNMPVARPN
jgi:hypothetical protein